MSNEAFEKWFEKQGNWIAQDFGDPKELVILLHHTWKSAIKAEWQAAKADSEQEIAELKNEVIERCAKVCDGYTHGVWFADNIRALKGTI